MIKNVFLHIYSKQFVFILYFAYFEQKTHFNILTILLVLQLVLKQYGYI